MSNSTYCIKCSKKILFESQQPSFCPFCAHRFASGSINDILKTIKPNPQVELEAEDEPPRLKTRQSAAQRTLPRRRQIEVDDYEDDEYIEVPKIDKIDFEIQGSLRNTQSIKDLSKSAADSSFKRDLPRGSKKRMNKKDFENFNKEFYGEATKKSESDITE